MFAGLDQTRLRVGSVPPCPRLSSLGFPDRRNGSTASAVAKELGAKGFGKCFVVTGGFDGRGGWVQSKLQIKPAASIMSSPVFKPSGTFKSLPSARS